MIYTRFGSQVEIMARHMDYIDTGWLEVATYGQAALGTRSVHSSELKADGGIAEINAAAMAAAVHTPADTDGRRQ